MTLKPICKATSRSQGILCFFFFCIFVPLLFFLGAFHPKKLHYSQSSRHQESHQFNSPCAAGQGLNANHPNTQPFVAGYKTSRAVQQKQIWDNVSPELPEVYCIFLHSQREERERSHTLTSPPSQQPAAEYGSSPLPSEVLEANPPGERHMSKRYSLFDTLQN